MAIVSSRRALVALGLLAAAAGCAPIGSEQTHGAFESAPAFGEAVKFNAAAQTINPDPVYAPGSPEAGLNGDAARAAAERYRKGTVKPLERESTTSAVGEAGSR